MAGPAPIRSASVAPLEGLEAIIERVLAGDDAAWTELAGRVHPIVLAICRRRRLGGQMAGRDDLHRDVAARTLDRLRAEEFAALRRYRDTRECYEGASFGRWLAVLVAHTFIDVLRARPEYQRRREVGARKLVRLEIASLDGELAPASGIDLRTAVEIRRILACLLDARFPALQRRALLLWLDGNDGKEIAAELALTGPEEARRLLHAARQRLRRRFDDRGTR